MPAQEQFMLSGANGVTLLNELSRENGMRKRPELDKELSSEAFESYYYLKDSCHHRNERSDLTALEGEGVFHEK